MVQTTVRGKQWPLNNVMNYSAAIGAMVALSVIILVSDSADFQSFPSTLSSDIDVFVSYFDVADEFQCQTYCLTEPIETCMAIIYYQFWQQCDLGRHIGNQTEFTVISSYHRRTDALLNGYCTNTTECAADSAVCRGLVCICKDGHLEHLNTCVKGCNDSLCPASTITCNQKEGNTTCVCENVREMAPDVCQQCWFQVEDMTLRTGQHQTEFYDVSVSTCLVQCEAVNATTCSAIVYDFDIQTCLFVPESLLDNIGDTITDGNITTYYRDKCQRELSTTTVAQSALSSATAVYKTTVTSSLNLLTTIINQLETTGVNTSTTHQSTMSASKVVQTTTLTKFESTASLVPGTVRAPTEVKQSPQVSPSIITEIAVAVSAATLALTAGSVAFGIWCYKKKSKTLVQRIRIA